MIGGTDLTTGIRTGVSVADVVLRTVRGFWPEFVVQDADDANLPVARTSKDELPVVKSEEFFVYRSLEDAVRWEAQGAVPETEETMLHVILGSGTIPGTGLRPVTFVYGSPDGPMKALMERLLEAIDYLNPGWRSAA